MGIYTGNVSLKQSLDAEGLSSEFAKIAGGGGTEIREDNTKLEIVKFDHGNFDKFKGTLSRVPKLSYE